MKKIFEGASITSAILLILTVACGFIFNVKGQKDRAKSQRHEEKMLEKAEKRFNIQRSKDKEELQHLRKLNDPLWHYYDTETEEYKVFPGIYEMRERVSPPKRILSYG